jgi:hypothetical protein
MGAEAERPCPDIDPAHHSSTEASRKTLEMMYQPPSLSGTRSTAIFRRWRLERQPEQLADELDRIPADGGQHVESDDDEPDGSGNQRCRAEKAEIDGPIWALPNQPASQL